MKTQIKMNIWEAEETLKALEAPYSEEYYNNNCIAEYKKKPYEVFVFTKIFGLRKSKAGKLNFFTENGNHIITGKSHKQIGLELEKIVEKCEGEIPQNADGNWIPEKWQRIKRAAKIFNLTLV